MDIPPQKNSKDRDRIFKATSNASMRKLAHIVNPVAVDESSDLFVAQPVTFETMKASKEYAKGKVDVELFTTQYIEDRHMVPDGFTPTPDLDRSVLDIAEFSFKRI